MPVASVRSRVRLVVLGAAALLLAALTACGEKIEAVAGPAAAPAPEPVKLDVPYVPTPHELVDLMLDMADVGPGDHLIDLGSGDGRIVIAAVRDRGVPSAVGVEIDPARIEEANANARAAGVEDRVVFERGDLFEKDFSDATVLTMYLLRTINLRLRPIILENLAPGTRVVSHVFDMADWTPDRTEWIGSVPVYLWIVPARVAGDWVLETGDDAPSFALSIMQNFQRIQGTATRDGTRHLLASATLHGNEIRFEFGGEQFVGMVDGDTIRGRTVSGMERSWHARRI